MAPDAFERLAQRPLKAAGFRSVQVLGRSGDGGLDGVGVYRVSLVSFPVTFQCERYKARFALMPSATSVARWLAEVRRAF